MIRDFLIFFAMFVGAGLGLPIPEELAIVAAGIWTGTHPEHGPARWLMLPVCVVGVIIADGLLYGIGRRFGTRLLDHRWLARLVPAEKRQKIEENFHRNGVSILVVGRLLPGIRTPLFLTAGTMRLPLARFLVADAIGAVLGNSLLFGLAFWFGDQFQDLIERAERKVETARPLIVLLAIIGAGVFLLVQFLRRPVPTGDPAELPPLAKQVAERIVEPHGHPRSTADAEPKTEALAPEPPLSQGKVGRG